MRKIAMTALALLLLLGVPFTAYGASNLSTEQKYDALRQKNIFTGFADGSARLNDPMSREQLAAVLYRLLELPSRDASPLYDDVLRTRWSYSEIDAVSRAKLMNGTAFRRFTPEKNVSVEQLAAILTRSYGLTGSGSTPVTGKVSKWARGAVGLALDRQLIPRLSDYTVDATRGLLVDAAYAIYEDTRVVPLQVRSVEQINNQSIRVNLLQWLNPGESLDRSRFAVKDVYGNVRGVQQASTSQDGWSIVLWTDRQAGGVLHTVTIDGATWSFVSAQDDTTKPQIVGQPVKLQNKAYEISFSEPVDRSSAENSGNYQLNQGLKIRTLQLSADQRKVTFTTSDQEDGRNYQLTVRGVKDLAGNEMDTRSDLYLVGSNDNTKPKVSEVKVDPVTALVSVKFSEKIDPQHAALAYHYALDKGLVVLQAVLDGDGKTVTLRTSPQQDGSFYTLTVSGIPDLAGNVMDVSTNWKFGAVSNPVAQATLQSLAAINKNTVEVVFNRALSDSDIEKLKLTDLKDNNAGASMSDWSAFAQRKPGTDRVATIQYRTRSSGNPELFRTGHYYSARVTGVSALNTAGGADTASFGGTVVDNPIPQATQVVVIDKRTVKVLFSEPVKNVKESGFMIWGDRRDVAIDYVDQGDPRRIVTEAVLKLDDELKGGAPYVMTFRSGVVTDAAGFNGIKTNEGDKEYVVPFNG